MLAQTAEYRIRIAEWAHGAHPGHEVERDAPVSGGGIGPDRRIGAEFRRTRRKRLLDKHLFEPACVLLPRVETGKWTKLATGYWKTICDVDKTALLDEVPGVSYIRRA